VATKTAVAGKATAIAYWEDRMKNVMTIAAALCLGMVSTVQAADCTGTYGWLSGGTNVTMEEGHTVFMGHFSGTFVANDAASPMHLGAVMCPALYEVDQGQTDSQGLCWLQDGQGDKVFYRWSCTGTFPECVGDFAPYAGTGKYEGISGKGTFKAFTSAFNELGGGHGYAVWDTCEYSIN
jgi:hypothetical protein